MPAFLLAFWAGLFHTWFTFRYFEPRLDELAGALPSWGPYLAAQWGPHLGRTALAALFFLSLPGLGSLFIPRRSPLKLWVSCGAGLLVWSLLGLLMAALGLSKPGPLKIVSAVLALAGLVRGRGALLSVWKGTKAALSEGPGWGIAALAVFYFLTTLVPDTFYDALVYHLAVPEAYLKAGRLVDLPDIVHARMPGLIQTLNLWALAWSDDRLCKLMNLGFGLLAAGGLAAWTGRHGGRTTGLWAALLFLGSPMIGVNLWSCANDVLCGFYFFLALALWAEERETSPAFFLSGLFFGCAAAVKYTALFGAPFFALDLLWRFRRNPRGGCRAGLLFAAGAVVPLLPWWARTGVWTGNPFYPRAAGLWGGDIPENLALLPAWASEARGPDGLLSRFFSFIHESLRGVEGGRFGFVGPALLMLLPLGLFISPTVPAGRLWVCAGVSYAAFAFATGRLRYFIPEMVLLFPLAALGLKSFGETLEAARPKIRSLVLFAARAPGLLKGLIVLIVGLNGLWMTLVFHQFNQGWDVVWGRESARDYLRREHVGVYGHPSQGAFDYLKDRDARGRVFIIGEARAFRCPLPARAAGSFNTPPYALWLKEDPSPESFLRRLQKEGYTYLLLNAPELARLTPAPYGGPAFLAGLGRALDRLPPPVYRDAWVFLFEIPPP